MMKRKGQGAMEYLMTYGWAILVVMIVGVVLWQLGIFGPSSTVNTARGLSKMKIMDPSIRYAPGGTFQFTLMNGAGQTVTAVNISLYGCDPATGQPTQNIQIGAGDTESISVACGAKTAGDSFTIPINITYVETVVGTSLIRFESGTIRGTVEKI